MAADPYLPILKMAALRMFALCSSTANQYSFQMLNHALKPLVVPFAAQTQYRWSSYKTSPIYTIPEDYTDYEIIKDPNEWKYVERILPYKIIPKPPIEDVQLPSGWKPAHALPMDNPYFIERTKNYMQPVYLEISHRGMRKITKINRIQGDIWTLEHDMKSYIEKCFGRKIGSQIHEFAGAIKFKGDHVSRVKEWMNTKGF